MTMDIIYDTVHEHAVRARARAFVFFILANSEKASADPSDLLSSNMAA